MHRRLFVFGIASTLASPAIVKASSLMPISAHNFYGRLHLTEPEVALLRTGSGRRITMVDEFHRIGPNFDPRSLMLPPTIGYQPMTLTQSVNGFIT